MWELLLTRVGKNVLWIAKYGVCLAARTCVQLGGADEGEVHSQRTVVARAILPIEWQGEGGEGRLVNHWSKFAQSATEIEGAGHSCTPRSATPIEDC
jgi:hypothetical protein